MRATVFALASLVVFVAGLGQTLSPPRITPTTSLQSQAAFIGNSVVFSVTVSGTAPLSYQWRLDGRDLPGQTNRSLPIRSAQRTNEGDYTVAVGNTVGTVTSTPPARLYVVATNRYIKANFTNQAGLRLPYFYDVPLGYDPSRKYPLVVLFHGGGNYDETTWQSWLNMVPTFQVFTSYKIRSADPAILVWPSRRAGNYLWTDGYISHVSELMDALLVRFSIDPDRIYLQGFSEGGHAVWDTLGLRTNFYAGARILSGWMGKNPAITVQQVPLWISHAADDTDVTVNGSRTMVRLHRQAGGTAIYTEYNSGGHIGGSDASFVSSAANDWLLAQRRGRTRETEPLLAIARPPEAMVAVTGAAALDLSGTAAALGQPVTVVSWTNLVTQTGGSASGTDAWSVMNIPLLADRTNVVILTAATISWAPGLRGSTTFNETLSIFSSPIRAKLVLHPSGASLSWTGGVPPYSVQRTSDLVKGDWVELRGDVVPPLLLRLDEQSAFLRIVGK